MTDDVVLQYRLENGTVDEKVITLAADSVVRIRAVNIPKNVYSAVVQAHSQIHPITLARGAKLEAANHANGTSVGILMQVGPAVRTAPAATVTVYLFNPHPFNITLLTFALYYDKSGERAT